jgi:hypothetical protein
LDALIGQVRRTVQDDACARCAAECLLNVEAGLDGVTAVRIERDGAAVDPKYSARSLSRRSDASTIAMRRPLPFTVSYDG